MARSCNHIHPPPSRSGLYTAVIHDVDGNELQIGHLAWFRCDTDMPEMHLTVEPKRGARG